MPHSPVEERWRSTLSAVSLTFGILASAVFALRVYASRSASCKMRAEDVLMGISVVLMWGTVASVLMMPKFWASSTACCKVAIILFLRRVVGFTRSINTTLVVVAVVSVLWAVAAILFSTFVCMPISFYWDKSSHNGHCMPKDHYLLGNIVFAVMNMVGDITILVIPLPTLWKSQMPNKQKIAITGVLSIGLILMRVVQFFYFDLDHISTSSALETLWTTLENEFAVICGCAPQLAPLFRGLQSSRSCKTKSSGYAGMYDTSVLGKHAKMSIIHTTVSGTAAGEAILGLRTAMRDGRSSSEVELKGIEQLIKKYRQMDADIMIQGVC
ncbi:hypothetical protein CRV24_002141 [Beauveria bassiana]|nr:hypothetical protein CRV24_002141 [Beauveria bassiana]